MTDTKYAKPALKFDDVPKWFKDMRNSSDFMPSKFNIKPMSYNYMALVETPNRSQAYTPASTRSRIDIGTQYHRPTDNVAKAIKSNQTVWQDIKNLGGEVKEHGGNLLGRALDVLSRPGYAIRNMYLENAKRNYLTPDSAGGTKMTGGEHLKAILSFNSPLALLNGQVDDNIKASWAGLSGKSKTGTSHILSQVTPGWWEQHKDDKLGLAASITGDILIDPTTWLTMGLNPGSVTRAGVGVGKLLTFDKAGAAAMFRDTIFTPTGMKQSFKTMKSDQLQADFNKLNAQVRKFERRGNKAAAKVAKGKAVKKSEQFYTLKATEYAKRAEDVLAEDLKGLDLAARMLRRNANPLAALQTASRFTTGAKAGSDILNGQQTIAAAADVFYEAAAVDMAKGVTTSPDGTTVSTGDLWNQMYAAQAQKPFEYTHNKRKYVVDFSKAETYHDFLKMIAQEAAPVAAYAEYTSRSARSRVGRITATEARGRSFQQAWMQHTFNTVRDSMDPTTWAAARQGLVAHWRMGKRVHLKEPVAKVQKTYPEAPLINEEDLLAGRLTYDDLMNEARTAWIEHEKAKPRKRAFKERNAHVIIVDASGQAQKMTVEGLRKWSNKNAEATASPFARAAAAAARTPEQKTVDSLTGVSDDLAGRRDKLLQDRDAALAEREAAAARLAAMTPEEAAQANVMQRVEKRFQEVLSDREMQQVRDILNDTSQPWETRLAVLLQDELFDSEEAVQIAETIFGVDAVNGVVTATKMDVSPDVAIPQIVQSVLKDRIANRFDASLLAQSGQTVDMSGDMPKIVAAEGAPYRTTSSDLNGEIGLALIDAWSAGLRYAADNQMLNDPKNFDLVMDHLAQQSMEFINLATADTKMQVMALMRNTFGVAFPESFVPSTTKITGTFGDINASDFKFQNATGDAPNQSIPWRNLAKEIKLWATSAVPWIKPGEDIIAELAKTDALVDTVRRELQQEFFDAAEDSISALVARVSVLSEKATPKDFNLTGTPEVANYSMLDYLLHTKEIIGAQKTQFVRSGATKQHRNAAGDLVPGTHITRLNIGRLSALDSFGYVDEETHNALEAIMQLKSIATKTITESGQPAAKQALAKQALALMFRENGGLEYLARVADINRTDFTDDFKTLGAHARLKQGVVHDRLNGGFGPKYAADLMEHMWEVPTINHEWQKALQHKILAGVVVEGRTHAQVAEEISKNVDEFFANHENIKRLLYPVFRSGKNKDVGMSSTTVLRRGDDLQQGWGTPNRVDAAVNAPNVEVPIGRREVYLEGGKTQFTPEELKPIKLTSSGKPVTPKQVLDWFIAKTKGAIELDDILKGEGTATKFGDVSLPRFADIDLKNTRIKSVFISDEVIPVGGRNSNNGYIIKYTGGDPKFPSRGPGLYYISPDGNGIFRIGYTDDLNDVEKINASLDEILSPSPLRNERHDPRLNAGDYRPGAHVMQKGVRYTKPKTVKTTKTQTVQKPATPEQLQGVSGLAEARWTELNAQAKADDLQQQIDATPVEPEAKPVDPTDEGSIELGATDVEDVINTAENAYSDEELLVIRAWIESTYAESTPDEVSKALYGHVMAMSWDLAMAQSRLTTGLADLSVKQQASVRFMGIPFMPMVNPMNATHSAAGVTALAEYRSGAHKFFANIMDPTVNPDSWASKARIKMTKESQLLEGTLFNIRRKAVNSAAMSRKAIIAAFNELYAGVTKGEYVTGSMAGLSKKERYAMASENLFDPAKVAQKDSLDIFELTDGSNPIKTVEALMESQGRVAFGDEPHKMRVEDLKDKLHLFNNYMPRKFRLTEVDMDRIIASRLESIPFSREWLSEVGTIVGAPSRLHINKLKKLNLAEFHYAMADASLKIEEGRELYKGVWGEYASLMNPTVAQYINDVVQPTTLGPNGEPMRGKLISLKYLEGSNDWGINPRHIPEEFRDKDYYVDSTFLPHIGTLFRYMEGTDKLADVLDAGFIDKLLQYFKASVTIYKIPTYPVRNMLADAFLSAMDGLIQPGYYKRAAALMQNAHRLSQEIDQNNQTLTQIMDRGFMGEEMARAAHDPLSVADPVLGPGMAKTLLHTADGTVIRLDDKQMVNLFDELGLGQNQIVGEVKESLAAARLSKTMSAGGKVHDGLRMLNDWRESWARMAHFMYALEKEAPMGGNLQDIAQRAAQRVIKHHFDYNDVSLWERNVLAPIIPFYKWVRNIIPYTLTSMITKPYMLKTEQAIQQSLAGLDDNSDDPRTDFVIPEYIRREQAVDVGWYADANGNKFMQWASVNLPLSETLVGLYAPTLNPLLDPSGGDASEKALNMGAGAIRTGVSMMNPLIKGTIQAATNRTVWPHGASDERAGESWFKTMAATIPGVPLWDSMQQSVKAMSSADGSTDKNATAQLLKELGIIGLTSNSEKAQIGEVKRIQDMNEGTRDRLKADLMNKLQKKYPQTTPDQRRMIVDEYVKQMRSASNG
jgi:hypothetical protein